MVKKVLIIKNKTSEGPGLLEEVLKERGIEYTITDLDKGEEIPAPDDLGALVVLGGPDSANDETSKMKTEILYVRKALGMGIPYLGICLGLQVLVKAEGGAVVKSPVKEVGFTGPDGKHFSIELTEEGLADPLFEGLGETLKVFHLHGETVLLTDDMLLLASGKFCPAQVVRIGANAYGIQCHFELTAGMLEHWMNEDEDLRKPDKENLKATFSDELPEYTRTGRRLMLNFLKAAGY